MMSIAQINPETFTWQGENEKYPFFADEDANITGYGHQDKKTFAEAVTRHDKEYWPEDSAEPVDHMADIQHIYVKDDLDNERFIICEADEEGAYPVTTLWINR